MSTTPTDAPTPTINATSSSADRAAWHSFALDNVFERLTSNEKGLSAADAAERLAKYGPNTIPPGKREGPLLLLWRQINSPLIWVLIASGTIAIFMGKGPDAAVVFGIVIVNAIIGFVQEYRANRTIEALSKLVPERATVWRDGVVHELPAHDLVPGDVVDLRAGDKVPADLRLFDVYNLQAEEAALTGESLPVAKRSGELEADVPLGDRTNLAFKSTLLTSGSGHGVVVETGARTELGRISMLLKETHELETPLTVSLAKIAKGITVGILIVSALIMVVGLIRGWAFFDSAFAAIALAVAAIPEGLPAVITIAAAIGVSRMAKRRAVIRHLPAVETLGSTTVICTDKTGTLTRNEMTARALVTSDGERYRLTGAGYTADGKLMPDDGTGSLTSSDGLPMPTAQRHKDGDDSHSEQVAVTRVMVSAGIKTNVPDTVAELLTSAALCNDASLKPVDGRFEVSGDPTESALLVAARKVGIDEATARAEMPRLSEVPFDSEQKYMATLHRVGERARVFVKGAPEVVLPMCVFKDGAEEAHDRALDRVHEMAERGMRVLAVATHEVDASADTLNADDRLTDLRFVGLIGMTDPPREEAIAAIAECHDAGIVVKMITGDHAATARAIAQEIGIIASSTGVSPVPPSTLEQENQRDSDSASGESSGLTDGGHGRDARATDVVDGRALAAMSEEEFAKAARETNVFARVAPEHKLKLVTALQASEHVVAMTGDGVNDAPALKRADIGVAMGVTGTSVAKEAAKIVLTDDNFASIAAAVEEGRRVFDNLIKSFAFILPTNIGLALIVMAAVFAFPIIGEHLLMPVQPVQILWINLVANVTLALPLALEALEPDVMKRKPRRKSAPVLGGFVIQRTITVAILMTICSVGLFLYAYPMEDAMAAATHGGSISDAGEMLDNPHLRKAQTMGVTTIIFFQIFYLLNCRSLTHSIFEIGLWSNRWVFVGIVTLLALQAAYVYAPPMHDLFKSAPLPAEDLALTALVGLSVLPVISIEKWIRKQRGTRAAEPV